MSSYNSVASIGCSDTADSNIKYGMIALRASLTPDDDDDGNANMRDDRFRSEKKESIRQSVVNQRHLPACQSRTSWHELAIDAEADRDARSGR